MECRATNCVASGHWLLLIQELPIVITTACPACGPASQAWILERGDEPVEGGGDEVVANFDAVFLADMAGSGTGIAATGCIEVIALNERHGERRVAGRQWPFIAPCVEVD